MPRLDPPLSTELPPGSADGNGGFDGGSTRHRNQAAVALQIYVVALMLFPSDVVFKPVGAYGFAAALVAMSLFGLYLAASPLGLHDPLSFRYPTRSCLILLWLASLASYAVMHMTEQTSQSKLAADRWLMQLAAISGVALVAAEGLHGLPDIKRVLRALTWGGAFSGMVAALQFFIAFDLTPYLRMLLPGFTINAENTAVVARSGLRRVTGVAIHPIELGVVSGMLLPIAIYLAMHDTGRSARSRWLPVLGLSVAVTVSVSRSAILAAGVALIVFLVLLPAQQRLTGLAAVPVALAAVFMTARGLIGTLVSFFSAGASDASVAARVDDYPLVERLVRQAPLFGRGGGTYIPVDPLEILDNQYLTTAIELGLVGLLAVVVFYVLPAVTALVARRRTPDPDLRALCAALAGAVLAAGLASVTFDALAFPMFASVYALIVGLVGCAWLLATRPGTPAGRTVAPAEATTSRHLPRSLKGR